eukprot:CAMPEP_0178452802 /NCGR_PEP_ID=MMETSP0689_2-20121128/44450_1 /TAXON_ID=160604 /ORGANISM="Amphidinium massartii, Strain CS-259" /LENGTH=71 /DNA_ID=CAMNT_0020078555 /DNA_START=53 /DNA_END=265 /DNA_ORIENTATION=+
MACLHPNQLGKEDAGPSSARTADLRHSFALSKKPQDLFSGDVVVVDYPFVEEPCDAIDVNASPSQPASAFA